MSRVLLVSSLLAVLPIAAAASSFSTPTAISSDAPSVITLGTPAEPSVETPKATKKDINRVVTPMVMRGGIVGGASPVRAAAPMAEMEPEIIEEAFDQELPEQD